MAQVQVAGARPSTSDSDLVLPSASGPGAREPLPWLKPAVAAAVLFLALANLLSLALAFVTQSMPPSHYIAGPIGIGAITIIWFAELGGLRGSLLVFAAMVTIPNLFLAAIGHNSVNFLYLSLTVAWVTYHGSDRESLVALAMNLAVLVVAALYSAASGQIPLEGTVSWAFGLVVFWLMTRAFLSQQRLAAELQVAQYDLTRQVDENQILRAAAERRLRDIEALYRADESLYGALRTERVLNALVDVVTSALEADQSVVFTWDAAGGRLVVAASHGVAEEVLARLSSKPPDGAVGKVLRDRRPLAIADVTAAKGTTVALPLAATEGIRSVLLVPILVDDQVFGVLVASYRQPRPFPEEEQRLFVALAQRTSLALENARLYEQAQRTAQLEERQRLARELHDAVTQTLFSSSLIADVLPRLWERDPTESRRRLDELRELTRGALAEMRTLLYELRPTALTEAPLGDLLRQLVEATIGHARLPVSLTVEGQRLLPSDVQVALYRIAQEALNNVVKHARAGRAAVSLVYRADGVELCVRDDGQGFDPSQRPPGHLGVGIMGDRAAAVGAGLAIASQPGQGTTVTATWPANGRWHTDDGRK
jgi:signal transduction histidine kinase